MPIFSQTNVLQKKRPTSLIRPLLFANRSEIQKASHFWNLPNYPDKSNSSTQYSRNRIRNQLLPTLRFFFNPQIDQLLSQFGEIVSLEHAFLKKFAENLFWQQSRLNLEMTQKNLLEYSSIRASVPGAVRIEDFKNEDFKN
jgi:tRNA(Ile)-lysidine synthase TilS/MesJ